jgi:hypothetical protein
MSKLKVFDQNVPTTEYLYLQTYQNNNNNNNTIVHSIDKKINKQSKSIENSRKKSHIINENEKACYYGRGLDYRSEDNQEDNHDDHNNNNNNSEFEVKKNNQQCTVKSLSKIINQQQENNKKFILNPQLPSCCNQNQNDNNNIVLSNGCAIKRGCADVYEGECEGEGEETEDDLKSSVINSYGRRSPPKKPKFIVTYKEMREFFQLLNEESIQQFLKRDACCLITDKVTKFNKKN